MGLYDHQDYFEHVFRPLYCFEFQSIHTRIARRSDFYCFIFQIRFNSRTSPLSYMEKSAEMHMMFLPLDKYLLNLTTFT